MQPLIENEYGFSVQKNNPFFIFPYLQHLAATSGKKVLDLSRGDPGLGASPNIDGRELFSFCVGVDTIINNNITGIFFDNLPDDQLWKHIESAAEALFNKDFTERNIKKLHTFCERVALQGEKEGHALSTKEAALRGIFNRSALAGGTYHPPLGEPITRLALASHYADELSETIQSADIIPVTGVNHAVGTLFQMLSPEGISFLNPGDTIAATTPAYAPYFSEMNRLGLSVKEIAITPETGGANLDDLETESRIKAFFIISPNNPTGTAFDENALKLIAEKAEKHDALVITDEIYRPFFPKQQSVWHFAEKRTLFLCGRSKIERHPGLRFGEVIISEKAREYITGTLLASHLTAPNILTQFIWAKGPGATSGSFQHTESVPGPSQLMGCFQLFFGDEERKAQVERLKESNTAFFSTLGLPQLEERRYYGIFNLNAVSGSTKKEVSIDEKLFHLAKSYGVVVIPAMKFFSDKEQTTRDVSQYVRVCLANLAPKDVAEAAARIHSYLTS